MSAMQCLGCSIGDLDIAAELPEAQRSELGLVTTTGGLEVWYLPGGDLTCQVSWPEVSIHYPSRRQGQLLVRQTDSNIYWHVAIIGAHKLYTYTKTIIKKEKEIHLYLSRRTPLFGHGNIESAVRALRQNQSLNSETIRKLLLSSILSKLPHLCACCGNETDKPKKVPDEPDGRCPDCLERHYKVCWSCGKTIPIGQVEYAGDLPYCGTCKAWSKGMGFS